MLRFWFVEAGPDQWFASDPAFDETLRRKFGALVEQAAAGALDDWAKDRERALALLLLLDQLPRNLFRGTARAFATDAKARAVATVALDRGFDADRPAEQRLFFYVPFMHSEDLADQDRSVALFAAAQAELPVNYPFAVQHRAIIERFGRFPHRNAALGRPSTEEEAAFLAGFAGF
ncbi:DUF924 family protein [Roseiterribacter gracilis]|uniref:DUF924 family protein n=1 Tax=Roseiterribacter gracilis TaxID=2812848 RepID=UPI003B439966